MLINQFEKLIDSSLKDTHFQTKAVRVSSTESCHNNWRKEEPKTSRYFSSQIDFKALPLIEIGDQQSVAGLRCL
jgi:hypothetical protein